MFTYPVTFFAATGKDPSQIPAFQHWFSDESIVESGGTVTGWTDLIGSSNLSAAGSPAYGTQTPSKFNGRAFVDFDGTNDSLFSTSATVTAPQHIFMVAIQDAWVLNRRPYDVSTQGGSAQASYQNPSTPQLSQLSGPAGNAVSPAIGTNFLLESLYDGSNSSQVLNAGTPSTGTTLTVQSSTDINLGSSRSGGSPVAFANVSIAAWAIANAEITGADLDDLRAYFNTRYKLY